MQAIINIHREKHEGNYPTLIPLQFSSLHQVPLARQIADGHVEFY